jgi:hypothetical protein
VGFFVNSIDIYDAALMTLTLTVCPSINLHNGAGFCLCHCLYMLAFLWMDTASSITCGWTQCQGVAVDVYLSVGGLDDCSLAS